jgi:hypothetical protein
MAAAEAVAIEGEQSWEEGIWEELLAYIEEERVIPIVGPASSTVVVDGQPISLASYVAQRLASRLGLTPSALRPAPTLNEIVSLHRHGNGRREALYPHIRDIVRSVRLAPPQVLRQLAEIRQFNLYVTTAFDPLLEAAINDVRFGGEPRTKTITYAPNNVRDLEIPKNELTRPTVYYLFGRLSASPNYAISDEDVLEFLHALQSESRCPERLFEALENNHLLIVGSNFPDWVARMFLRMAKGRRLSDPRDVIEILADDQSCKDPGLVAFLNNFSPRSKIFRAGADAFVGMLSQRCRECFGDSSGPEAAHWVPPPLDMPDRAIFISYASQDLPAVRTLKSALEAVGLSVWFDLDRIGAGDTFDQKIRENIRHCSLFVAVLSHTTEKRTEGVFRREWTYALDRDRDIHPGTPFIIPVAIDDIPEFSTVPQRFNDIRITRLPAGQPTLEFVDRLKLIGGWR